MPNTGDSAPSQTEALLASNQRHHAHPAHRLQNSPSLPNIRSFTQPAMVQPENASKNGPSAPPSPKISSTETGSDKKDQDQDKESRPRHVKYASIDPIPRISRHGAKAHNRRRTERDQPHALLTPPLTPSSSIRTTTSDSLAANAKVASGPEPDDTNDKNLPELEAFAGLTISTAGAHSNVRQRFNFPPISSEYPGKDQGPLPQPANFVVEGAQSPPFFYTTTGYGNNAPGHGRYQQLDPGHMIGTSMGPMPPPTPTVPSQMGFPYGVNPRDHSGPYPLSSEGVPTCYTPDGICSYCPSRTPVANCAPYTIPCPTPMPAYFPAQVNPNLIQSAVNPVPSFPPLPPFFPYEYMEPQSRPLPSIQQWGFDPAIAAVGPGPNHLVPVVAVNGPSAPPFFIREEPARQFHPQYQQVPIRERELEVRTSPQPFAHISTPTPDASPKYHPSNAIVKYDTSISCATDTGLQNGIGPTAERNQLSLARIKAGDDLRTTVMIKNIPNKMSDTDLTAYIDKVCPRRIDFLYLRMDFKNGCNVGYAFVNFITVQDLAHFVEECLGTKWNMFSSEKILQMSYANFQGKEALIEKFKNSSIMDEREAWRPRIFYTSGENQGLPEPFPAPSHIRRKERSSVNRGTLYPPGTNSHHHLLNSAQRRYNEECRYLQNRSNERLPARLRDGGLGLINSIAGPSRQRGGGPVDKVPGYLGAR